MEAKALVLICLIIGLGTLFQLYFVISNYRKYLKLANAHRDEVSRANFANARRKLFRLANENKISFKDELFKELYAINTSLMVAKGNYRELGMELHKLVRKLANQSDQVSRKSPTLNDNYFEVLKDTIEAFGYIAFEYVGFLRFIAKIRFIDSRFSRGKMLIMPLLAKEDQLELQKEYRQIESDYQHLAPKLA